MIVASVVTVPDRNDALVATLDELLLGTVVPDFLYVSIATFYPRLNKSLSCAELERIAARLSAYPVPNRLVRYAKDPGPCAKLLTPLREHPLDATDRIVILDDDTGLFPTALECLVTAADTCGNDAVYGIMGVKDGRFVHGEQLASPCLPVDGLGGYRGVLYPCSVVDHDSLRAWVEMFVEGYEAHGMIAMHDDHIFSYYLQSRGVERRVVAIHPKPGGAINYVPKPNDNGIFQDPRLDESLAVLDEVLTRHGIVLKAAEW